MTEGGRQTGQTADDRRQNGFPAEVVQAMPEGIGPDICTLVKADLEGRAVMGKRKYGERLKPNNGRDALVDAYQESLALCMYLRQVIVERDHES